MKKSSKWTYVVAYALCVVLGTGTYLFSSIGLALIVTSIIALFVTLMLNTEVS